MGLGKRWDACVPKAGTQERALSCLGPGKGRPGAVEGGASMWQEGHLPGPPMQLRWGRLRARQLGDIPF